SGFSYPLHLKPATHHRSNRSSGLRPVSLTEIRRRVCAGSHRSHTSLATSAESAKCLTRERLPPSLSVFAHADNVALLSTEPPDSVSSRSIPGKTADRIARCDGRRSESSARCGYFVSYERTSNKQRTLRGVPLPVI